MATRKTAAAEEALKEQEPVAVPEESDEDLVEIQLFKDGGRYSDDVYVCVNGERVLIQRGKKVKIKRKFAKVLEQSMQQDINTANMIQEYSNDYDKKRSQLE